MSDLSNAFAGLDALSGPPPAPARPAVRAQARAGLQALAAPSLAWTAQQQALLERPEDRLDVVALAGTGKTTVLLEYARRRPHAQWRYLTFNRSLADALAPQVPAQVQVRTFHSLAFARFGADLGNKVNRRFDPERVRRLVGWSAFPGWENAVATLREWRKGFLASADELPALGHLPPSAWSWLAGRSAVLDAIGGTAGFLRAAEQFWAATVDPRQEAIDAPLDVAVKRMVMAEAIWAKHGLLIDEAQDLTPCLLAGLAQQPVAKVIVGDPYQQLYAWRMARQAWPDLQHPPQGLTQAFRFGPEIAALANRALATLGSPWQIEGVGPNPVPAFAVAPVDWSASPTWLARTQAGALEGALAALAAGQAPRWLGKASLARIGAVLDVAQGRSTSHPWVKGLASLDELEELAVRSGALEWQSAVRLVQRQGADTLERGLEALRATPPGTVHVGTVHQAKGQTFDWVHLAPDLRWESNDAQERAIHYVALTRSPKLGLDPAAEQRFERWLGATSTAAVPPLQMDDGF